MGVNTPRKAIPIITYTPKGKKPRESEKIGEYLQGFSYVDCATGQSDTATITLNNTNLKWANSWLPKKGDKFTAKIKLYSWDKAGANLVFKCGTFCCDDKEFSGWPSDAIVGGLSVPEKQAFRSTSRSKTWKNVTIKEIARQIAKRYGLQLSYYASTIKIKTLEQSKKNDADFLNSLCEDYGLYIKVYSGKIVIYDPVKYEAKKSVKTFSLNDLIDYSYNSTLTGTYTGATIKYTKGKEKKEYTYKTGSGNRILSINEKVDSLNDAKLKTKAQLNKENRKAETMTATITANLKLVAGNCITIKDGYDMNGKYFIDKATHSIKSDGIYTISVEMHKIPSASATKEQAQPKKETTAAKKQETKEKEPVLKVGDKVIVNGGAYYAGNGGRCNSCSNMTMYITQILGGGYKYQYGVAKRKGGTRYGWCAKSSLKKA